MMHRDALIAHFALLGWEPIQVVENQYIHRIAMLNGDRIMYIDSYVVSRHAGNVVHLPASPAFLIVRGRTAGWDDFADHNLREFYRALAPDRSPP
ncbi:hypothetical protein [Burkholderia anthina]|uniref:hypothetical protein n=1 Tax=Burkholderia anthina TaxID=179879 RepID=UPI0037C140E1